MTGAVGPTPAVAVAALLGRAQRALSCVSDQVLAATGWREGGPFALGPAGGEPIALSGAGLLLTVRQSYAVRPAESGGLLAGVVAYAYALDDARDGREVLAWHWHAGSRSRGQPHLHLGAASGTQAPLLGAHLPSGGPVELAAILWLLIDELGARPRRADWRPVLGEKPGKG